MDWGNPRIDGQQAWLFRYNYSHKTCLPPASLPHHLHLVMLPIFCRTGSIPTCGLFIKQQSEASCTSGKLALLMLKEKTTVQCILIEASEDQGRIQHYDYWVEGGFKIIRIYRSTKEALHAWSQFQGTLLASGESRNN